MSFAHNVTPSPPVPSARFGTSNVGSPDRGGNAASFVRPPPSPSVSLFGGDVARRADAEEEDQEEEATSVVDVEEDAASEVEEAEEDAVPAEDDSREKE